MAGADKSVKASIQDAMAGETPVQKWTGQIAAYDREFSKWQKRVEKILKKYRGEDRPNNQGTARFNVLWSNVQTLIPATFAKVPKADVSRRFRDTDPVGRVASLILERATEFEIEHYPDFADTMKQCVFDRFLGGRGTAWARYEPHMRAAKQKLPMDGEQVPEDVDEPGEELDYECAPVDYVHWRDFGHSVARTWEEVTAVWRCVYMTRAALVERFGKENGGAVPLDGTPDDLKKGEMAGDNERLTAAIYEIWDKQTKRVIWLCKACPNPLDEIDDPLGLEEFWPCPKPLYATMTNESLVPVPDWTLYQDQARELDTLAERIDGLIAALQVKGVYDDSIGALARIFTEGTNGTLIPVKNWAAFAEKNGLAGAIDLVDLKPIYEALKACYEAMQEVLKQIYDLTGLADIVRGQSEASETATAQQIKGQYASLRLRHMQGDVARFASGLLQLKAQIMCAKFDAKTLLATSASNQLSAENQALIPQAIELLLGERAKNPEAEPGPNPMRTFRIEVNADSMVQMDEQEHKQSWTEALTALGNYLEKALPMVQEAPPIAPLVASIGKSFIQAFKVTKEIEGEFDSVIDKLQAFAQQPRPPKPDPAAIQAQSAQTIEQMRLQHEQALEQAKSQREAEALAAKQQAEAQKAQFDAQQQELQRQHDAALEQMRLASAEALKKYEIDKNNERAIIVAEIAAKSAMDNTLAKAEQDANTEFSGEVDPAAPKPKPKPLDTIMSAIKPISETVGQHGKLLEQLATQKPPKGHRIIRGADGKVAALETVQ